MKQITKDDIIDKIINGFQHNKGKSSVYCFSKSLVSDIVLAIVKKFANKHKFRTIFICVDCYNTRVSIKKILDENNINKDNKYNIRVLTAEYIQDRYYYNNTLTILVGVNDNYKLIKKLSDESKFTLCILTENIMKTEFITKVRDFLPFIDTPDYTTIERRASIYSPVEEHRIGVELSTKDTEQYNKYNKFITNAISIFSTLDNIEKCKYGDKVLNISASEFRTTLAKENGWNEHLDTKISFMKQIDDNFNPNVLEETANNFYNITRYRQELVSDNEAKLEVIKELCITNKDKRILIISKRGKYAAKITKYLNDNGVECLDYHDSIENRVLTDDYGNVIVYKSGANKGMPLIAGSQLQSSLNEQRFNNGMVNVLSIKFASNTKLKTACDIAILTTPLYDNIIDIKQRFNDIVFNGDITKIYVLYCINTIENEKLIKTPINRVITVIDDNNVNFIEYDENSGDIIL